MSQQQESNRMPAELSKGREKAIPQAVQKFSQGGFVLVMDDFDRENECDLIILGETLTPQQMAFMIKFSTGIVCVVADKPRLEKFGLYPATKSNTDKNATNFYVATDYLPTTTTGVSARDRCETVRAFCRDESTAEDFSKPGHMFPLCPRAGGVLERGGHTESAYDLCRLAGKQTVAAIGELMREDGEMMRLDDCIEFSKKHHIPLVTVDELREWVRENGASPIDLSSNSETSDCGVCEAASLNEDGYSDTHVCSTCCTIPVRFPSFTDGMRLQIFDISDTLPVQVVAAIKGNVASQQDVAVRIHSECFTGDVLRSAKCDCGLQLEKFFSVMEQESSAVLLYVRGHEGRGIGLAAKFDAYRLQEEQNLDTVDSNVQLGFKPDLRSYHSIARIIPAMGIKSVRLFTNNREKIAAVQEVVPVTHEPCQTVPLTSNKGYLKTKEERMDHMTTMVKEERPSPIEWPCFGDYTGFRVGIVSTAWKQAHSNLLLEGCEGVLRAAKCAVSLVEVPGAMDLVSGCRSMVKCESAPHAVVALGTFIRGDTESAQMQYQATIDALQQLNAVSSVPIISGVVFCNSKHDVGERSNAAVGSEWAKSALQMISVCGVNY